MSKRKSSKTPREYFMQAVEDELAKFERKEIALQRTDRDERAAKLGLPASSELSSEPTNIRIGPHNVSVLTRSKDHP